MAAAIASDELKAREREIVMTRVFAAPRAMVWGAFANPWQVSQWWGPKGFRTTITEMDLRAGGKWCLVMHGPDGTNYPNEMTFLEVVPLEKVVLDLTGGREGAEPVRLHKTIRFTDEDGGTRMTIRIEFPTAEERDRNVREYGSIEGGRQMFDRLEAHLLAKAVPLNDATHELSITRVFNAPRELVWQAWTDPRQLALWWGPKGFTNPVCEADARPGGAILIHMLAPNGAMHPMTGQFLEVVPPERLVFTSAALDADGQPMFENRNTVVFTPVAGGTEIGISVRVIRTTPIASRYLQGMELGWSTSLERLAALVEAK